MYVAVIIHEYKLQFLYFYYYYYIIIIKTKLVCRKQTFKFKCTYM